MSTKIPRTFSITVPVVVSDAKLAASSVPEPGPADPVAWASGGNYVVGNQRHRTTTHRIYECIQTATGRTVAPETDTLYWKEVSATQRWKMFDPMRTVPTVHTSPLVVDIVPGQRCNAWALSGVSADAVTVSMIVGVDTVYSKTVVLTRRDTRSWSDYYFGTFQRLRAAMDNLMPLFSGATIRFEFTAAAGTVSVGKLVVGRSYEFGAVEVGGDIDAENYSVIDRSDVDGTVTNLRQRRNLPRNALTVFFNATDTDLLLSLRDQLNAVPAVYSGLGNRVASPWFASHLLYGLYRRFRISPVSDSIGRLSIETEEM
jgi:hypothetical protein